MIARAAPFALALLGAACFDRVTPPPIEPTQNAVDAGHVVDDEDAGFADAGVIDDADAGAIDESDAGANETHDAGQIDLCAAGADDVDVDADTIPDACDACLTTSCAWPAEQTSDAQNLTAIEGAAFDNDFGENLSGAFWDPLRERLWLCRNGGDDSKIWAVVRSVDDDSGFAIEERGGARGEWTDFGDLEGLTMASLDDEFAIYGIVERVGDIIELDASTYGTNVIVNRWNIEAHVPSADGPEGIAFVPDEFLEVHGFVDDNGALRTSSRGMGGLMFVAHQLGGRVYAFDLERGGDGAFDFVGAYRTARSESADLSFDASTGLLYVLHGASFLEIEAVRLSSTIDDDGERVLDSVHSYAAPDPPLFGGDNFEGIAIAPATTCDVGREFFLTIDGGSAQALFRFVAFPCR